MNEEKLAELENFDWDAYEAEGGNTRTHNPNVKASRDAKVYSREPYAQELYDLYFDGGRVYESKDLVDGIAYKCKIDYVTEGEVFASTESGQTVYVELEKELKDAKRLNITGLSFLPGNEITLAVRKVNGNYFGSAIDHYIGTLKVELFQQIKDESTAYVARIESINKGGYIANISGIKCFLPGSLAAANKITDFESYIGKDVYVMIESYLPNKDIFVVSYKKYLDKIMEHKIQELDLTKKYKGSVTGTSNFGVFVEWEDIYTGLLHKTELGGFSELSKYSPGDEIEFYVKEVRDDNRLTLTFSEPLEKTLNLYEIEGRIKDGELPKFDAVIKHVRKNGMLVDIPELKSFALVPTNNLSHSAAGLRAGDETEVSIYEVDAFAGKMFAMISND